MAISRDDSGSTFDALRSCESVNAMLNRDGVLLIPLPAPADYITPDVVTCGMGPCHQGARSWHSGSRRGTVRPARTATSATCPTRRSTSRRARAGGGRPLGRRHDDGVETQPNEPSATVRPPRRRSIRAARSTPTPSAPTSRSFRHVHAGRSSTSTRATARSLAVIEAMDTYYPSTTRTSIAASTRSASVRPLPTRLPAPGRPLHQRALGARDRLRPQRDEATNLALELGRRNIGRGDAIVLTRDGTPRELRPLAALVQEKDADLEFIPITDDGCCASTCSMCSCASSRSSSPSLTSRTRWARSTRSASRRPGSCRRALCSWTRPAVPHSPSTCRSSAPTSTSSPGQMLGRRARRALAHASCSSDPPFLGARDDREVHSGARMERGALEVRAGTPDIRRDRSAPPEYLMALAWIAPASTSASSSPTRSRCYARDPASSCTPDDPTAQRVIPFNLPRVIHTTSPRCSTAPVCCGSHHCTMRSTSGSTWRTVARPSRLLDPARHRRSCGLKEVVGSSEVSRGACVVGPVGPPRATRRASPRG